MILSLRFDAHIKTLLNLNLRQKVKEGGSGADR